MPSIESTSEQVAKVYARTREALDAVRAQDATPLTLSEKIIFGPCSKGRTSAPYPEEFNWKLLLYRRGKL